MTNEEMINKKYSLYVHGKIKATLEGIREIYLENKNLVSLQKNENENVLLHIKDIDPKSDFYFKVIPPVRKNKGREYTMTEFKPNSRTSIESNNCWSNIDSKDNLHIDTINAFKSWIELLKEHNKQEDIDTMCSRLFSED